MCERCGSCWERDGKEVDSVACPGCPRHTICESRPTWLVEERTQIHRLPDGGRVLVRPLLYSDRNELAEGFEKLSDASRRSRFFNAPERLSGKLLEYLTNLDYQNRFAWAARALDDPGTPGIGVARYIRDDHDPTVAEAAVTVIDEYQGRGVGSLLLRLLTEEAYRRGIRTFVGNVLWENDRLLDALRASGARISADEPGIARMEVDLATAEDAALRPVLRVAAESVEESRH